MNSTPARMSTAPPPTTGRSLSRPPRWRSPDDLKAGPEPSLPQVMIPPPTVEAAPPTPPNWEEHLEEAVMSLSIYQSFPVDPASQEFNTVAEMMAPFDVASVEQVVNPELFRRYESTRTEMLRRKSEDLALLRKLKLGKKLVQRRAYQSENFVKDPRLASGGATYSPNEVLLFHCTKSKENVEKILNQGLDERLSSYTGGCLGKGIYFTDDPLKSCQYEGTEARGTILVFSVMLGDSLFIQDWRTRKLVREPEKELRQKRTPTDQFFDSVTARPTGNANEYVIYNRGQCCPMYLIKYKVNPGPMALLKEYMSARGNVPPIAWNPMPNDEMDGWWPLFAASLFKKMRMSLPEPEPDFVPMDSDDGDASDSEDDAYLSGSSMELDKEPGSARTDLEEKIANIVNLLGIEDEERIKMALEKKHYDLDETVNYLLENKDGPASTSTSRGTVMKRDMTWDEGTKKVEEDSEDNEDSLMTSEISSTSRPCPTASRRVAHTLASSSSKTIKSEAMDVTQSPISSSTPPVKEECTACLIKYMPSSHSPQLWKVLKCGHRLCQTCYKYREVAGTTMGGVQHTSVKCSLCQGITGTVVGSFPCSGTMTHAKLPMSCAGYPEAGSIQIRYMICHGGQSYFRIAFLPDTPEGQRVLKLLESAWDSRLIFTIGASSSTGGQTVPEWKIQHKTRTRGGVGNHGYPDPDYLERVKGELKAFGIE